MQLKINLNQYEKIIDNLDLNNMEKYYDITLGNFSYFRIYTNINLNKWKIYKINKKSKIILKKEINYKYSFEFLLNIALNS